MTSTFDPVNQRVDGQTNNFRQRLEALTEDDVGLHELRRRWELMEARPVFFSGREQGVDASWHGMDIRTLLSGEDSAGRFCVNDVIVAPGAGLPPHYRLDGDTYVIVGAGQLTVQVGHVIEELSESHFAFIPSSTRFAFRNASDQPASMILIHSPAGIERAFSAANAHWMATGDTREVSYLAILERFGFHFDARTLDRDAQTNTPVESIDFEFSTLGDMPRVREAFASRAALPRIVKTSAEEVASGLRSGDNIFRKPVLTGDDSGGQAMVHLLASTSGLQAPPHHQTAEEEIFFVRRGEVQLTCGSEFGAVGCGAFGFAPRHGTHAFHVRGATPLTQFFTINSPAGHERALAVLRQMKAVGAPDEARDVVLTAGDWVMH